MAEDARGTTEHDLIATSEPEQSARLVELKGCGFPVVQFEISKLGQPKKGMSIPLLDKRQARGFTYILDISEENELALYGEIAASALPEKIDDEERKRRATTLIIFFALDTTPDEFLDDMQFFTFLTLH